MNLLDLARAALAEARAARPTVPIDGPARQWRVVYPNLAMTVLFTPAATRGEVAELHPGATCEPMTDTVTRTATPAEADELRRLIVIVLAGSPHDEQREALTAALADVDAALECFRLLAAAKQCDKSDKRPSP